MIDWCLFSDSTFLLYFFLAARVVVHEREVLASNASWFQRRQLVWLLLIAEATVTGLISGGRSSLRVRPWVSSVWGMAAGEEGNKLFHPKP